jgi:geranylgeranyl pyrophosphate synthase
MNLTAIYSPVAPELVRVEARLKDLARADLGWLPAEVREGLRRNAQVPELLAHILSGGGKRLRPALVLLSGRLFDYNLDRLLPMAAAVETMHIATLVHDDAIDHSDMRWGRPTVNRCWDADTAILLGDFMVAQAAALTAETGAVRAVRRLGEILMTITVGELAQRFSAFDPKQTRQHYLERISSKTAALFALTTEMGTLLGGAPEGDIIKLHDYGHNIGVAFQIIDDILDYTGTEKALGKPIGADLREGTLTLPAMLFMERYPGYNPVRAVFENQDREANLEHALRAIEQEPDIIRDCYSLAESYITRAKASLASLTDSPSRRSLEALADFVISRNK